MGPFGSVLLRALLCACLGMETPGFLLWKEPLVLGDGAVLVVRGWGCPFTMLPHQTLAERWIEMNNQTEHYKERLQLSFCREIDDILIQNEVLPSVPHKQIPPLPACPDGRDAALWHQPASCTCPAHTFARAFLMSLRKFPKKESANQVLLCFSFKASEWD